MREVVLFFLGASLVLYAVLGGADFGAGILEWLAPKEQRAAQERVITRALGPVWEANHVWLIVAVVVLFNGFPPAFRQVAIAFHLPLTALLIVIILRGCAFTFRHYDAPTEGARRVYTAAFEASSLLAPILLGLIAGGVFLGRPTDVGTFVDRFVTPWASTFGLALGVFLGALFVFVAAAFLTLEAEDEAQRASFVRRARAANLVAVVAGALVFPAASVSGLDLLGRVLDRPLALGAMAAATALLVPMHLALRAAGRRVWPRLLAAAMMGCVLLGWFALQYPYVLPSPTGGLTIAEAAAPPVTLLVLGSSLLAGSALMFPALAYLFWVFKRSGPPAGGGTPSH